MRNYPFTRQKNINLNLKADEVSTKEKYHVVIKEKDWGNLIKLHHDLQVAFSKIEATEFFGTILKKETINFLKAELNEFLKVEKKLTKRYVHSPLKDFDKKRIKEKIEAFLLEENNVKNNEFKLADLAEAIGEKKHHISQTISEEFPLSFNDLVNQQRIELTKQMLKNPDYNNLTFYGIAQEVGFKSKSTFNRAFLKFCGIAPNEYRNS